MPFNLSNALVTFQCNMDLVLLGLMWVCMLVYMDDIIIYSATFKQHLINMDQVCVSMKLTCSSSCLSVTCAAAVPGTYSLQ